MVDASGGGAAGISCRNGGVAAIANFAVVAQHRTEIHVCMEFLVPISGVACGGTGAAAETELIRDDLGGAACNDETAQADQIIGTEIPGNVQLGSDFHKVNLEAIVLQCFFHGNSNLLGITGHAGVEDQCAVLIMHLLAAVISGRDRCHSPCCGHLRSFIPGGNGKILTLRFHAKQVLRIGNFCGKGEILPLHIDRFRNHVVARICGQGNMLCACIVFSSKNCNLQLRFGKRHGKYIFS